MKSNIHSFTQKTLTCILLAATAPSFAQTHGFTFVPAPGFDFHNRDIDTVPMPDLFPSCYDNLVTGMVGFGPDFISGTNSHHDQEKAQLFKYAGGGNVTRVHVAIGMKTDHASATGFVLHLYTVGENGPEDLLGTSQPLTFDEIHTASGDYTTFTFTPSVSVPDSFFVSAVVSTGDPTEDEIVLVTLVDGSNIHNPCGKHTAWEKQADDGWYEMSDNIDSWGVDLAFLMIPEIDNSTSGIAQKTTLTNLEVYPNPASGTVNFACAFDHITDALLSITDITGKTVYTGVLPARATGTAIHQVNVSDFASGVYYYRLSTQDFAQGGKLVVE